MRKVIFVFSLFMVSNSCVAQSPTMQDKLYHTCKVWGFVKYYHSNVSVCNVNWDSVLLHVLPLVRAAGTIAQFNDALDSMLTAAGPMTISSSFFPDTLPLELKRNRDWSWISSAILRSDVQIQLDTIKNNFRPHSNCWVTIDPYEAVRDLSYPWGGYLEFTPDTVILPVTTYSAFPDQDHRLLQFFKFWNIIEYFNPYNYVLDTTWDSTLHDYVLPISNANNAQSLYLTYLKIASRLNDVHVFGLTYSYYYQTPPGFYLPHVRLKYIQGQYVVIKSTVAGINIGDAVVSVDGLTPIQWEDSLRPYYSSGNVAVFRRSVCQNMLGRQLNGTSETLVLADSTGVSYTITTSCINWYSDLTFFKSYYYPADSLSTIKWTTMPCDVGYVNLGNILQSDLSAMYGDLQNKNTIIFDVRNYPNNTIWNLADLLYPTRMEFAKFLYPDVNYPGTFYWYHDTLGIQSNPTPYNGKVIILMDEITQSQAEFSCMALAAMPNSIRVGSQTAGADGDVTWFKLSNDISFGYTSLGTFYPNSDSTQRIGIVPDTAIYPTKNGIRHGDDEVLDKALGIACVASSVPKVPPHSNNVTIYPNPVNDIFTVEATNLNVGIVMVSVSDISGRVLIQKEINNNNTKLSASFNIKSLSAGMYFVHVKAGEQRYMAKVIKE